MRKRTQARELALQLMYQFDLRGGEIGDDAEDFLLQNTADPEVREFARGLFAGCREHLADIDAKIGEVAKNWQLKRMAAIDRNILRLATFEILHRGDIPPLVTINEAIDIAKKFSTKNSGSFVNGILDNIRLTCAPPDKRKA